MPCSEKNPSLNFPPPPSELLNEPTRYFFTPQRSGPSGSSFDPKSRMAWSQYAMSFFDSPNVALRYEGLDPAKQYELRVVFNAMPEPASLPPASVVAEDSRGGGSGAGRGAGRGAGSGAEVRRLVANGQTVLWPPAPLEYASAPAPMAVTAVGVPRAETSGGSLEVRCEQPPGTEGNGRTCQISEVWLVVVD